MEKSMRINERIPVKITPVNENKKKRIKEKKMPPITIINVCNLFAPIVGPLIGIINILILILYVCAKGIRGGSKISS